MTERVPRKFKDPDRQNKANWNRLVRENQEKRRLERQAEEDAAIRAEMKAKYGHLPPIHQGTLGQEIEKYLTNLANLP